MNVYTASYAQVIFEQFLMVSSTVCVIAYFWAGAALLSYTKKASVTYLQGDVALFLWENAAFAFCQADDGGGFDIIAVRKDREEFGFIG